MNPVLILIYVVCGILIALAVVIFVKTIRRALKGKCCESCKSCHYKQQCDNAQPPSAAGIAADSSETKPEKKPIPKKRDGQP